MDVFVKNDCTVKSVNDFKEYDNTIILNCEKGTLTIDAEHECCEEIFFAILNKYPLIDLIGKKIIGCERLDCDYAEHGKKFPRPDKSVNFDELFERYGNYKNDVCTYYDGLIFDVLKLTLENSDDFYIGFVVFSNGCYAGDFSIKFKENK